MSNATGMHHIAISTADMKGQIDFFTQVLGAPLVGLFDMHGVEGGIHSFLRLDDATYLSFVQLPAMAAIESTIGVTHAGTGAGVSAPGTMQHLAMAVADNDELLAMRDRLRSHGVVAFGPIEHGMCTSIYFAGLEGLTLEVCCAPGPIDQRAWIDPAVAVACGIDEVELESYRNPMMFERPAEPVPQPAIVEGMPRLDYPDEAYRTMVSIPDDVITRSGSYPDPPVAVPAD